MSRPRLEFWYEFASTYSYPAVMRVERIAAAQDVEVVWRPFLLGPIFRQRGFEDSPFNANPVKGRYMWRDLARICAAEGLVFRRPSVFPRNGLLAARAALAGTEAEIVPFSRAVFEANFAHDREIADPETLRPLITATGGDAGAVLARAATEPVKAALRRQVERAIELGIFGAPSFVAADGELFWGNDRLEPAVTWAARG